MASLYEMCCIRLLILADYEGELVVAKVGNIGIAYHLEAEAPTEPMDSVRLPFRVGKAFHAPCCLILSLRTALFPAKDGFFILIRIEGYPLIQTPLNRGLQLMVGLTVLTSSF